MTGLLICMACAAAVLLAVGVRDANRFVTVEYRFRCRGLKRKYRFVMLSDLHNHRFGAHNERLLARIEGHRPDGVLIAGDMVTSQVDADYGPAAELAEALAGKYPVYYANGNHEHRMKTEPKRYGAGYGAYHRKLEKLGVVFLENGNVFLPEPGIRIFGVEIDRKYYGKLRRKPMPEGYLPSLLGQARPEEYTILLAHNPDYFPEYAGWGADLVLAGHVHGGIMRLPGLGGVLSPALRLFPEYDGGLFERGKSRMVLGRGLGSHTIPLRFFNPGELIVVTLVPEAER